MKNTIIIRRAALRDIPRIGQLLVQVCNVHAAARPDLFIADKRKYNDEELSTLIQEHADSSPILVATDETDFVQGYAFCQLHDEQATDNRPALRSLYLDDLCVDAQCRGKHIGTQLYGAVRKLAQQHRCHSLTLNVWACNPSAKVFYERQGLHPLKTYMEERL
ncbi:MAG: GNAT family N-acetyltransferase [Bacteroidaceae bacterium]|nr:GNAT family N-acetyltransferase [Bacteroidaceae bacterium]